MADGSAKPSRQSLWGIYTPTDEIKQRVREMDESLTCQLCNQIYREPSTPGLCSHIFCKQCIRTSTGWTCPECGNPSMAKDVKPHFIATNLVDGMKEFKEMFGLTPYDGDGICEASAAPNDVNMSGGADAVDGGPTSTTTFKRYLKTNPNRVIIPLDSDDAGDPFDQSNLVTPRVNGYRGGRRSKGGRRQQSDYSADGGSCKSTPAGNTSKSSKWKDTLNDSQSEDNGHAVQNRGRPRGRTCSTKVPDSLRSPVEIANNKTNMKGETPLHKACMRADLEAVTSMLCSGANPNVQDNCGWTPLHEAVVKSSYEIAKCLIERGAFLDPPGDNNETPLYEAVYNGKPDLIRLLVHAGANIHARNLQGVSPWHFSEKNPEIRKILMEDIDRMSIPLRPEFIVLEPYYSKLVIFAEELPRTRRHLLQDMAQDLKAKIASNFSSPEFVLLMFCCPKCFERYLTSAEVTHFIAPADSGQLTTSSCNYMMALAKGKWILSPEWMEECLRKQAVVNPEPYEISGCVEHPTEEEVPRKARLNRWHLKPGLFKGIHFTLHGNINHFSKPTKEEVQLLIKAGDGTVLCRSANQENIPNNEKTVPYHTDSDSSLFNCSHVVLYAEGNGAPQIKYNMAHFKSLSIDWFERSILTHSLVDPRQGTPTKRVMTRESPLRSPLATRKQPGSRP